MIKKKKNNNNQPNKISLQLLLCDLVLNDLHRVQGDNQRDSASLKNHLNVLDFCFFPEFHVSALKAAKPCFQRTLCVCVCQNCVYLWLCV